MKQKRPVCRAQHIADQLFRYVTLIAEAHVQDAQSVTHAALCCTGDHL